VTLRQRLLTSTILSVVSFTVLNAGQSVEQIAKLTPRDLADIMQLSAKYAKAVGTCAAEDYASLFTADGYYSSSEFTSPKHRALFGTNGGQAIGHDRLVTLVMTEPYCMDPNGKRAARNPPAVVIKATSQGARGTALLPDGGRYEDMYVKTTAGWRFKSRTHIREGQTAFEATPLVLTAKDETAIRDLSARYARALGLCRADDYAAVFTTDGFYSSSEFTGGKHREMYGPNGGKIPRSDMSRFVMSEPQCMSDAPKTPRNPPPNIAIRPSSGGATASIPLPNGDRYEDIYVKTAAGWRIRSREHVRVGQEAFSTRSS
jgi:SnoaL-like domain